MSDWVKRAYDPETDEDAVLFTWIRSLAGSRYGTQLGAHVAESDAARDFWDAHRPMVLRLMDASDIVVICDPDRATVSADGPPLIWGWLCTEGEELIHYVLVKRNVVREGLGADIVRDLLGSRLSRPQRYTFELVEMKKLQRELLVPISWALDTCHFARSVA